MELITGYSIFDNDFAGVSARTGIYLITFVFVLLGLFYAGTKIEMEIKVKKRKARK